MRKLSLLPDEVALSGVAVMLERIGSASASLAGVIGAPASKRPPARPLTISGPRRTQHHRRIRTVRIEIAAPTSARGTAASRGGTPQSCRATPCRSRASAFMARDCTSVCGGAVRRDAHQPGGCRKRTKARGRLFGTERVPGDHAARSRACACRESGRPPRPCVTPAAADAVRRLRPDTHRRLSGSRAGTACAASAG